MQPPSANSRAPLTVDVAGQRLKLSGQADAERVASLVSLVNERYDALQRAGRGAAPTQVLAMLALNLADDVLAERERADAAAEAQRKAQASADERVRAVESTARRAIGDALALIDDALAEDDAQLAASQGG